MTGESGMERRQNESPDTVRGYYRSGALFLQTVASSLTSGGGVNAQLAAHLEDELERREKLGSGGAPD